MSFFVTVTDGRRKGLLVGPYITHGAALAMVEPARRFVLERDDLAHWYGFGTSRVVVPTAKTGRLNDQLGYQPDHLP